MNPPNISRPSTRKGSHAESKASHGQNSVSFQMFLILLSSITLCSESQIPVFKEGQSNTSKSVLFCLFVRGEHAQKPKFGELHKALRSVQFLASFTSFYFEILSYLACGEKIIRLASKNSVKLDEKSASDF